MDRRTIHSIIQSNLRFAIPAAYVAGYILLFSMQIFARIPFLGLLIIPFTLYVALKFSYRWSILSGLGSIILNWLLYTVFSPVSFFSTENGVVWIGTIGAAVIGVMAGYIQKIDSLRSRQNQSIENLEMRLAQEEALSEIVKILTSKADLNDSLNAIAGILGRFYKVPRSGLALLNPEETAVDVVAAYCAPGYSSSVGETIPLEGNLSLDFLITYKKVLYLENAQTDPMMAPVQHLMVEFGVFSMLIIPIIVDDKFIGSIGFDCPDIREFSVEEQEFGQKVANLIGSVIQRKQAEQRVKDGRDFLQQIMETMSQGVIVADETSQIVYANHKMANMLGVEDSLLIGQSMFSLFDDPMVQSEASRAPWKLGKTIRFEAPLNLNDGSQIFVLVDVVPRRRNDEVTGFTAVFADLTARKEIETALQVAKTDALEASRMKSEFLASMSHEIRTPLNGVIGMTSLMLQTSLTHEQVDYARTIRNSGEQLLGIINDILDFSKIEAGKMELEAHPFDVRECVEQALDVMVTSASVKKLELAYLIDSNVPTTMIGDVTRVRQILVNLVGNAVKFTETGDVLVRVQAEPAENGECAWHFSVRDTGIGIPEDRRNRLFQSFSQVDSSTTRQFGGTGLGLAICKRITELMGGQIWVESEVGQGSTFHFTVVAPVGGSTIRVYMKQLAELQDKRVLVVDDNETNRRILIGQLTQWGMNPVAASSGPQALDLLARGSQFDVAILDMHMPAMDGLELAESIRRKEEHGGLPLIMLSSISDRITREDLFSAHLAKPVKTEQLHQILQKALNVDDQKGQPSIANVPAADQRLLGEQYPLSILLVEDNIVNQKVASRLLNRMGYEADLAANGLEAIEALVRQPYQIILMDAQMPEMDGLEATEHIRREIDPDQQPYIIALTANAMTHQKEAYLAIGMNDYVSKPVRLEDLEKAIKKAVTKLSLTPVIANKI